MAKEKEVVKKDTHWHAKPPVRLRCSCVHPLQDKLYGAGVRLFTVAKGSKRCTVCGAEKF